MKQILGDGETRTVIVDGFALNPAKSQKLYNHSPDGFNWGYGGSGPAQLALALLLKFTDEKTALALYQKFKFEIIAGLPQGKDFALDVATVTSWIEENK